jgi:hypothetical protein
MTESSDASDTPAKPQDYAGLRTELATLVNDFAPLINELWPRRPAPDADIRSEVGPALRRRQLPKPAVVQAFRPHRTTGGGEVPSG